MRRTRVLVVDDEPMICEVIRMMLEDKYDVAVAASGLVAKKKLEADAPSFDVILCDLMMGDLSGIELYRWLRATRPRIASRMAFMTGGAYTPEARQFVDATPARFIDKPLTQATLEGAVAGVVAEHGLLEE